MRHPSVLQRETSVLVVVDVQKKLTPDLVDRESVLANLVRLVQAARLLAVPTLVTEQNPGALGPTLGSVAESLADYRPVAKQCFSALGSEDFTARLLRMERKQVVVCGIMTHVCVAQTALDALARGLAVHVVTDAVSAWQPLDHQRGLEKLRDAGAVLTTTEMAIYEWLERADTDAFKALLPLLKKR